MRLKSIALGLLLSAAGSLMTTPAAAEWDAGTLTLEAKKAGNPSGSTTYLWSGHTKGMFAVRFDYDNISLMKGRAFSGVGFLNCENGRESEYYWTRYDLSEKDGLQLITEYSDVVCADLKRLYPNSPALESKALKGKSF